MRAIQITEYGGPDVLRLRELPDPEPGDGKLLVETVVCGVKRDGSLRISVGGRYPLGDAERAHEDLQGRRTSGKLLLLPR